MIEEIVLEGLKEACKRAGNQLELAKSAKMSQGQLSDYLCGRRKIKNMTLGTLEKLFPEMRLQLWQDTPDANVDHVELQIMSIVHSLSPANKARCLKLLAANFPEQPLSETKE